MQAAQIKRATFSFRKALPPALALSIALALSGPVAGQTTIDSENTGSPTAVSDFDGQSDPAITAGKANSFGFIELSDNQTLTSSSANGTVRVTAGNVTLRVNGDTRGENADFAKYCRQRFCHSGHRERSQ